MPSTWMVVGSAPCAAIGAAISEPATRAATPIDPITLLRNVPTSESPFTRSDATTAGSA